MLTEEQQKRIEHLSSTNKIKIVPFDPTSQEKFEKIKSQIISKLGSSATVLHCGSSGLGISGKDEIDVYVPVSPTRFDSTIALLRELFGEPGSYYPLERSRFNAKVDAKYIEVHVINEESKIWLNNIRFEEYLKTHPETLEEYRVLKESLEGVTTKEYYAKKTEFINKLGFN
jgi:GrpB-like predicted nucleotidyltransferase (UPF0157 family)